MSDLPTWDNSPQAKAERMVEDFAHAWANRFPHPPPLGANAPTNQHTQEDK